MTFKAYDALNNFVLIARHDSLSAAADRLHLTKGALSQQTMRLEAELGFRVFDRSIRGITLTEKGRELLRVAEHSFGNVESKISELSDIHDRTLTIGMSTYFASRWLSPRLMGFLQAHSEIRLRIQPMIDLTDFTGEAIDLAIRWGNGVWGDCQIERLLSCPAWPTGNLEAFERTRQVGLEKAFSGFTLLRDRDDSNAWSDWYQAAKLGTSMRLDTLIIPDPNVRVQAVLDGQGVALNDSLVADEIERGRLFRLSSVELKDYGYFLAYQKEALDKPQVQAFIEWIKDAVV